VAHPASHQPEAPAGDRLDATGITVSFSGVQVLRGVRLRAAPGEIVGLLGANGSGKSTMVKVLSGVYQAEAGSCLTLNGEKADPGYGPLTARALGVRVSHQESPLIGSMTVADMLAMQAGFPTQGGFIRQRRLMDQAAAILRAQGVAVAPDRLAGSLSAGERAMVSLALALRDVDPQRAILILDEATAALSTPDAGRFLRRAKAAADSGVAVIMVTHRLAEVREFCSRVVVLRDGEVALESPAAELDERAVLRVMVGGADRVGHGTVSLAGGRAASGAGAARLEARSLRGAAVREADLALAAGEIVGVTGRADSGASDLLRLVAGVEPRTGGTVTVGGAAIAGRGPRDAVQRGVVYLSPDRLIEGGVATMTVAENLTLPRGERYWLRRRAEAADVAKVIGMLDVRPPRPDAMFGTLSGGNQQKVLLGRWLLLDPTVLLLDDPTAGIDPNTRDLLFKLLGELAAAGVSVLIRSTEPEQLARLCGRVLVMQEGRIATVLEGEMVTTEEIGLATYA